MFLGTWCIHLQGLRWRQHVHVMSATLPTMARCNTNTEDYLLKDVVLLHDNSRPHTATYTAETLRKLKFDVMAHPPYSPNHVPSDCHVFGPLRGALWGS
jgi:hypothetical protein